MNDSEDLDPRWLHSIRDQKWGTHNDQFPGPFHASGTPQVLMRQQIFNRFCNFLHDGIRRIGMICFDVVSYLLQVLQG